MKKIILLFVLGFLFNSCSEESQESYEFYLLPVYEVAMPETFNLNTINRITIRYKPPTNCHFFSGFNYKSDGYVRTVSIESAKIVRENCMDDGESIVEQELQFKPTESGLYHFKFWTGISLQGEDQYIEYDIEVN
jgi:hypothetical protein